MGTLEDLPEAEVEFWKMTSLPSMFDSSSLLAPPIPLVFSEEDSGLAPVTAVEFPPPLLAEFTDSLPGVGCCCC